MSNTFIILIYSFSALLCSSIILNIIGIKKEKNVLKNIAQIIFCSTIAIILILSLIHSLPDSKSIIIYGGLSYILRLIATILYIILNSNTQTSKKSFLVATFSCYALSIISFILLLLPSFELYPLEWWGTLIITLIYTGLLFLFSKQFFNKENLKKTGTILGLFAILEFLNISSLYTLFGEPHFYALIFFVGTLLLLLHAYTFVKFIIYPKYDEQNTSKISTLKTLISLLFMLANLLICIGCILLGNR